MATSVGTVTWTLLGGRLVCPCVGSHPYLNSFQHAPQSRKAKSSRWLCPTLGVLGRAGPPKPQGQELSGCLAPHGPRLHGLAASPGREELPSHPATGDSAEPRGDSWDTSEPRFLFSRRFSTERDVDPLSQTPAGTSPFSKVIQVSFPSHPQGLLNTWATHWAFCHQELGDPSPFLRPSSEGGGQGGFHLLGPHNHILW